MRKLLACLVLLGGTALVAEAQEFRATVNGKVTDTTKAAVPGATVIAHNDETNETATVTTGADGNFTIPFLKPGTYTVTVQASGFKKYGRRVRLEVSQTATINVELGVGNLAEEVSVTAEAPLLDLGKADRGTVIDNLRVTELPLNARNPFMLSMLVAGVNYNGPAIYQRPFDNGAIADWSINGGANRNNEFLLDGAPNNSIQGGNNIAYVPPVDAVQEFKIVTNSYDAQYGRTAGGVVNVSLKSGTNRLHGSVYEFMRRKWLDANTVVLNARGAPKSRHFLDQYGFQVDGPVRIPGLYDGRDKTFFLFNYEGYREGTPSPQFSTVPTDAFRRGDFSQLVDGSGRLITIYDPATGRLENGVWVRDPFPGNIIPASRIDPVAKRILGFYPSPNNVSPGVPPWQSNLANLDHINRDKFYNWVAKLDHNFGARDRMFVRYGQNHRNEIRNFNAISSGPAQDGQLPLERINYTGVADWVHLMGSAVLNVRASANRYVELARADPGMGFDAAELGFPTTLSGQLPIKMFPRLEAEEFVNLGRDGFTKEPTNVFSLQPNVSLFRGAHNVRFGTELRITQYSRQVSGRGGMRLRSTRGFTQRDFNRADALSGNAFASFLLGAPSEGQIDFNVFPIYMWKYIAPWIQDDWKVTRKLTLNLGLRWDFNRPLRERFDRMNFAFDPSVVSPVSARIDKTRFPGLDVRGGLRFAGVDGNPREPWRLDENNLQPRLGAVYQLDDRTVLRGGVGRYYLNPVSVGFTQGFSVQTPFVASLDGNRTPLYNLANPYPSGVIQPAGADGGLDTFLGRAISFSNPDFKIPHVDQFSIGVQRQLPWDVVVEVSYVGSRTRDVQTRDTGINEPPQSLRDKCDVTQGGNRAFCDERLPNPFFGVPGFEGTAHFTSPTLSRYDLSRPFPQFGRITETERNDGKIWFDSLQVVLNKRMSRGLTLNGTYTYVPRFDEEGTGATTDFNNLNPETFVDEVARVVNRGPYRSHRPHRITASGVWQVPVGKGRRFAGNASGLVDRLLGGWELAVLGIYQSGQPWHLPEFLEIVKDPFVPIDVKAPQFIKGVQPCVAQLRDGRYQLIPISVAAGCTEPNFLVREPYQTRRTMFRDDRLRRPSYLDLTMNLAKTTRINDRVRLQIRLEAFNVLNSPMYDERDYQRDQNNPEFGTINKNTVNQSNFPRFIQLGFKLLF
jgi:hypothetical protein